MNAALPRLTLLSEARELIRSARIENEYELLEMLFCIQSACKFRNDSKRALDDFLCDLDGEINQPEEVPGPLLPVGEFDVFTHGVKKGRG